MWGGVVVVKLFGVLIFLFEVGFVLCNGGIIRGVGDIGSIE